MNMRLAVLVKVLRGIWARLIIPTVLELRRWLRVARMVDARQAKPLSRWQGPEPSLTWLHVLNSQPGRLSSILFRAFDHAERTGVAIRQRTIHALPVRASSAGQVDVRLIWIETQWARLAPRCW